MRNLFDINNDPTQYCCLKAEVGLRFDSLGMVVADIVSHRQVWKVTRHDVINRMMNIALQPLISMIISFSSELSLQTLYSCVALKSLIIHILTILKTDKLK